MIFYLISPDNRPKHVFIFDLPDKAINTVLSSNAEQSQVVDFLPNTVRPRGTRPQVARTP